MGWGGRSRSPMRFRIQWITDILASAVSLERVKFGLTVGGVLGTDVHLVITADATGESGAEHLAALADAYAGLHMDQDVHASSSSRVAGLMLRSLSTDRTACRMLFFVYPQRSAISLGVIPFWCCNQMARCRA